MAQNPLHFLLRWLQFHLNVHHRVASDKTHCKPFDLGNLSSGYLDRPMYANHTISLEYTLLHQGLFFNSEVSGFQHVRENRAEELN